MAFGIVAAIRGRVSSAAVVVAVPGSAVAWCSRVVARDDAQTSVTGSAGWAVLLE